MPSPPSPPSLYGAPRPKSRSNAITLSSTSIHTLSTELALARSRLPAKSAPARARPSKPGVFSVSNKHVSSRAAKDLASSGGGGGGGSRSAGGGKKVAAGTKLSDRELARSKKRLTEKAGVYAALKRGEIMDESSEALVDFDRKWAEDGGGAGGSGDDGDDDDDEWAGGEGDEVIEYIDEFGRTRTGARRHVEREQRRGAAARKAEEEAEEERWGAKSGLLVGDVIQTRAFTTAVFSEAPTAAMLAGVMPKEEGEEDLETHYDASKEVRTKGVGFYQFSTDSKERRGEMEELLKERERTGGERRRVEEKKKERREEIERRREEVKRRRRGKVGESWLEGFMGEIEGEGSAVTAKEEGKTE